MTTTNLTAAGFLLLTLIFFGIFYRIIATAIGKTAWTNEKKNRIKNRFLMTLVLWAVVVSAGTLSGFASNFDNFPFNVAPFMLVPLIVIIMAVWSKNMRDILAFIPPRVLTLLQVFRVPVELLLWALFVQQAIPVQMTFEGRNLDILSGILGLIVGIFFSSNRKLVWIYNFIGLALLINIVGTAILSMPTPFRYFTEGPANVIVLTWPGVFLPAFLVPLAYGLHFLSLRQLALKK